MGVLSCWPDLPRIIRATLCVLRPLPPHFARSGAPRLVLPLLATLVWSGLASAEVSKEYQIKAVLLFNLTRFVDWPDSTFTAPDAPLVIGVVGRDPFGDALDEAVRGEEVNGHKIVVQRYPTASSIGPCQILFISANERRQLSLILAGLKHKPVLTVSELPGFATSSGGMIRFYTGGQNKVRLQINLAQARQERLKLSSKLLEVAEVVEK